MRLQLCYLIFPPLEGGFVDQEDKAEDDTAADRVMEEEMDDKNPQTDKQTDIQARKTAHKKEEEDMEAEQQMATNDEKNVGLFFLMIKGISLITYIISTINEKEVLGMLTLICLILYQESMRRQFWGC